MALAPPGTAPCFNAANARARVHPKWQAGTPAHALNERAGAQAHFIDLCRVLGVPEPGDPESYCFERGVTKTGSAGTRTPEWTERVPEVVPLGMSTSPYPDRIVAKAGHEADLAKRTLTNLYNQRPAWLVQAHAALDAAVAAAYGWTDYTAGRADEEILCRLLALNHERSATEAAAAQPPGMRKGKAADA